MFKAHHVAALLVEHRLVSETLLVLCSNQVLFVVLSRENTLEANYPIEQSYAVYPRWGPSPIKYLQTEPLNEVSCVDLVDIRRMPGS